jgi:hypothetical protein
MELIYNLFQGTSLRFANNLGFPMVDLLHAPTHRADLTVVLAQRNII